MEKIAEFDEVANKYKRTCSCGCVTVIPTVIKNKKDYKICRWCGKKLFKDDEKQNAYNKQVKAEDFRVKMWDAMKNIC